MSRPVLGISASPRYRPSLAKPSSEFATGKPKCPPHIKSDAVDFACWKAMVKMLATRGTLTVGDGPAIELYVAVHHDWLMARDEVKTHGLIVETVVTHAGEMETVRKENPAQKVVDRCAGCMRQLLKEFGATPAARDRAKMTKNFKLKEAPQPGSVGWILEQQQQEDDENVSA